MADWNLMQGHCLDVLRTLPDEAVACVITSPPYQLGPSLVRCARGRLERTARLQT